MSEKYRVVELIYDDGNKLYEVQNEVGYPIQHFKSKLDALAAKDEMNMGPKIIQTQVVEED